jgi:hypothetical protein
MEHFDNMSRDDMLEMRQKRRAQLEERAKMMDVRRPSPHTRFPSGRAVPSFDAGVAPLSF